MSSKPVDGGPLMCLRRRYCRVFTDMRQQMVQNSTVWTNSQDKVILPDREVSTAVVTVLRIAQKKMAGNEEWQEMKNGKR